MTKKLQAKIEKFLSERRKSVQGDWAEITAADVMLLHSIISDLIAAKCEPDADGDRPINFLVINRRECEPLHFRVLPYRHNIETLKELQDWLRAATANLSIATEQVKAAEYILSDFGEELEHEQRTH